MSWLRWIGLIAAKELRETLRDRRTLIVMILLPLSLYPLVGIGLSQYIGIHQSSESARPSRIGLDPRLPGVFTKALSGQTLLKLKPLSGGAPASGASAGQSAKAGGVEGRTDTAASGRGREKAGPGATGTGATVRASTGVSGTRDENAGRVRALLAAGRLDLWIGLIDEKKASLDEESSFALRLLYDETRDRSRTALSRVERQLDALRRDLINERLARRGLAEAFVRPLRFEPHSVASKRERSGFVLAKALPLLLVLMVLLGAFYPAIDLTAGEKERGTLETLLCAPVPRFYLIIAKFLVVTTIAMVTGLLNLGSIGLTLAAGLGPIAARAGFELAIPWSALLMTVVALLPTAAFFSALMMAVAALARSFKEAQNLLTPVYLVCMLPAMLAQLPGLSLGYGTALIPAVNVSLVTRDLISGRIHLGPLLLSLLVTTLYALGALVVAARMYDSERMLYPSERRLRWWKRKDARALVGGDDSPREEGSAAAQEPGFADGVPFEAGVPSFTEAFAVFLAVMALIVLVGQPLQVWQLVTGLALTEWVLIALPPLVMVRLSGGSYAEALQLRAPTPRALLGAVLAGGSAWYVVAALVEGLQQRILPMPKALIEQMQRMLFNAQRPIGVDLLVFALSPAVCEELLFRGLLLRAARTRLGATAAVGLTSLLFGIFHLSVYRFASTAVLGAVIGTLVWRSRSLYVGMVFHALNNGLSLLVGRAVGAAGAETKVRAMWLLPALGLSAIGLYLSGGDAGQRGAGAKVASAAPSAESEEGEDG